MQINLLKPGYKRNEAFYRAFLSGDLSEYIDENKFVFVDSMPDFPVYLGKGTVAEKRESFLELVDTLAVSFQTLSREFILNELFWHSYLCIYKREFLLKKYPQIEVSQKDFENIVTKAFDWENYIYKGVLAVQYVSQYVPENRHKQLQFYELILDNFDLFNYIIKYEIFRNGVFLIHLLEIVSEENLGYVFKARIKDRSDLGKDERYGRRVIYEFNKSYPIVLAPMLTKEQLKPYVLKFLSYYYHDEDLIGVEDDIV